MKNITPILACLILALLPSCGTNVFQSVPSDQPHAILKPEVTLGNYLTTLIGTTQIIEIDNHQPSYWRMGDTFRISPGEHSIGLLGLEASMTSMVVLKFTAQEGKTYIAKSDKNGGLKMKFWIEEKDSKQIVATILGNLQLQPPSTYPPIFIPVGN